MYNFIIFACVISTSLQLDAVEIGKTNFVGDFIQLVKNGVSKYEPKENSFEAIHSNNSISSGFSYVNTTSGQLIGNTLQDSHAFYSIPYAKYSGRFKTSEVLQSQFVVRNVSEPNYLVCQQTTNTTIYPWYTNKNESCLVLNVHVPLGIDLNKLDTVSKLPVLFWIPGGAFDKGAGTIPPHDGHQLSNASNCIVVSINYRLGAYGFLFYKEGDETIIPANLGIKDQQLAMEWVQLNIENFGGDKNMVTVFGESAGAQSISLHLVSNVSRPFYKRAIMESPLGSFPFYTPDQAQTITEELMNKLKCKGQVQCLFDATTYEVDGAQIKVMVENLLKGSGWDAAEPYRPIIDGVEFLDQPLTLYKKAEWNTEKEVLLGTNAQELEVIQEIIPYISEEMFLWINDLFVGKEKGPIAAQYYMNLTNTTNYAALTGIEGTHLLFECPSRAQARMMSNTTSNESTYLYLYSKLPGAGCSDVLYRPSFCNYVYHSSEIPFVFGTGPDYGYTFDANDMAVVKQFSDYWGNFAWIGDPSTSATTWPVYSDEFITIENPFNSEEMSQNWISLNINAPSDQYFFDYDNDVCNFWDSLGVYANPSYSPGTVPTTEATITTEKTTFTGNNPTENTAQNTENSSAADFVDATTNGPGLMTNINKLCVAVYCVHVYFRLMIL